MNLNPFTGRGRHRAIDEVIRLRHELAGAGDHIAALTADRDRYKSLYDTLIVKTRRVDEAQNETKRLRTELAGINSELIALRQFKANATKVSIGCGERDIEPGDEATQPVPAGAFWADPTRWKATATADVTVVVPLASSPQAVSDAETTQNIPVAQLPLRIWPS